MLKILSSGNRYWKVYGYNPKNKKNPKKISEKIRTSLQKPTVIKERIAVSVTAILIFNYKDIYSDISLFLLGLPVEAVLWYSRCTLLQWTDYNTDIPL